MSNCKVLKLKPFYSEKIWGYEKWSLSTHKNGESLIEGSEKTIKEEINEELPILIKIIEAKDKLSVQVHPDDSYANKYENDSGKTECWFILEAKEDASLICGIKNGHNKNTFKKVIDEKEILSNLNEVKVKKGDMIYIPSGTVHAIKEGIKLIEIQQSSDVTYRIYDWGRNREVNIEKSLDVIDYNESNRCGKIENFSKLLTPYFTVEFLNIEGIYKDRVNSKFHTYTVVEGKGIIFFEGYEMSLEKEESVYVKKGCKYDIIGNLKVLKSYI